MGPRRNQSHESLGKSPGVEFTRGLDLRKRGVVGGPVPPRRPTVSDVPVSLEEYTPTKTCRCGRPRLGPRRRGRSVSGVEDS